MRPAADTADFWRAPVGRYFVAPRFFYFCTEAELCGFVIWGELAESDLRALAATVGDELTHVPRPHASFVDVQRATSVHASGYGILQETIAAHGPMLVERISKMVLVRPSSGLVGAMLAGIQSLVSIPHPVEIVASAEEALASLGVPDQGLLDELDAIYESLQPRTSIIDELRGLFATHPPDLMLPAAAKLLGVSQRSLQRRLRDAGTSYQQERNLAQVRRAQTLILESDAKLTQVAIDVGCPSLQHFSALFRRVTGETPSQWRARQKPAPR